MLKLLVVRLFLLLIALTVVLNIFAILYKLSPLLTTYMRLSLGIFNSCPTLKLLLVRLLSLLSSDTVVSYFLAIEYQLSPGLSTYIT